MITRRQRKRPSFIWTFSARITTSSSCKTTASHQQQKILPDLIRLAKELDVGLVATNDCHYLTKEDSMTQKILICIQTNHTLEEDNGMEFETEEFYVKSRQEMFDAMRECTGDEEAIRQALDNTVRIAERCQVEFTFGHHILPKFEVPDGKDNVTFFREKCCERLCKAVR